MPCSGYQFKVGAFIQVNCPAISSTEWHPFSIFPVPGSRPRAGFHAEAVCWRPPFNASISLTVQPLPLSHRGGTEPAVSAAVAQWTSFTYSSCTMNIASFCPERRGRYCVYRLCLFLCACGFRFTNFLYLSRRWCIPWRECSDVVLP